MVARCDNIYYSEFGSEHFSFHSHFLLPVASYLNILGGAKKAKLSCVDVYFKDVDLDELSFMVDFNCQIGDTS